MRQLPPRQISAPGGKSMTDRGSGQGLDINEIVRRAQRGGALSTGMQSGRQPMFGDVSRVDYLQSLNAQVTTRQAFDSLPSHLRIRFANDPSKLLQFLDNEENRPEAEKLGLVRPKQPPQEPLEDRIGKAVAKNLKPFTEPEKGSK